MTMLIDYQSNMQVPTPEKVAKRSYPFHNVNESNKQEPLKDSLNQFQVSSMNLPDATLMHNACKYFSNNALIIDMVLQLNPKAIRVPFMPKKHCNAYKPAKRLRLVANEDKLGGAYPLHIALSHNASFDVVKLLTNRDPSVLILKDVSGCTPLHIAVRNRCSFDIISQIVSMNSAAMKKTDNRQNLPLHTACSTGCTSDVVMLLVSSYPTGLQSVNRNGKTPLDLAILSGSCEDAALNFLQDAMYKDDEVEELEV